LIDWELVVFRLTAPPESRAECNAADEHEYRDAEYEYEHEHEHEHEHESSF
jgi:hypothetical protein